MSPNSTNTVRPQTSLQFSMNSTTYLKDAQAFYQVDALLQHRSKGDTFEFLVKWRGYSVEQSTWEPEINLIYLPDMVYQYKKKKGLLKEVTQKEESKIVPMVQTLQAHRPRVADRLICQQTNSQQITKTSQQLIPYQVAVAGQKCQQVNKTEGSNGSAEKNGPASRRSVLFRPNFWNVKRKEEYLRLFDDQRTTSPEVEKVKKGEDICIPFKRERTIETLSESKETSAEEIFQPRKKIKAQPINECTAPKTNLQPKMARRTMDNRQLKINLDLANASLIQMPQKVKIQQILLNEQNLQFSQFLISKNNNIFKVNKRWIYENQPRSLLDFYQQSGIIRQGLKVYAKHGLQNSANEVVHINNPKRSE